MSGKRKHAPIEVTVKLRIKGHPKVTIKATAGPGEGRSLLRQARALLRHAATDAHRAARHT